MKTFGDAIEKARQAASLALTRSVKAGGGQDDEDLAIYERLGQNQFNAMVQKYGAEATITYIKEMEAKRMKNGNT